MNETSFTYNTGNHLSFSRTDVVIIVERFRNVRRKATIIPLNKYYARL